jgi:hypothetical protein
MGLFQQPARSVDLLGRRYLEGAMTKPDATVQQRQQIQVTTGDETSRGHFSNNLLIAHSGEEFILDWILNAPNGMHLVSRIIVTPGHMKRIVGALTENLRRYEKEIGPINALDVPDGKFH